MKQRILDTIKPDDILRHYGIESVRGKYLCPFHNDTNPSLTVKGDIWSCWTCGLTGKNAIDFVMEYEGVGFGQALDILKDLAGISESEKKRARTHNVSKQVKRIDEDMNYLKNLLNFDYTDKQEIKRDLERLEYKKEYLISGDLEIELERAVQDATVRNNRAVNSIK